MRAILVRDGIAELFAKGSAPLPHARTAQQVAIPSGSRRLDGLLLLPASEIRASVLILHGIGERLSYWREAQEMLARHGIASLIFDYSGYGKSTGATTQQNLRQDTVAAYETLRALVQGERPPFLLGLSLGTGVAVDAAPHLVPEASGVVLCEAFTSLRSAAEAVLAAAPLPGYAIRALARLLPDVYRTAASIRQVASPLLIVHSDSDELFPMTMAQEISAAARENEGQRAELFVPHGYAHNDAYLKPVPGYWQPILDFLLAPDRPPAKR